MPFSAGQRNIFSLYFADKIPLKILDINFRQISIGMLHSHINILLQIDSQVKINHLIIVALRLRAGIYFCAGVHGCRVKVALTVEGRGGVLLDEGVDGVVLGGEMGLLVEEGSAGGGLGVVVVVDVWGCGVGGVCLIGGVGGVGGVGLQAAGGGSVVEEVVQARKEHFQVFGELSYGRVFVESVESQSVDGAVGKHRDSEHGYPVERLLQSTRSVEQPRIIPVGSISTVDLSLKAKRKGVVLVPRLIAISCSNIQISEKCAFQANISIEVFRCGWIY